MYDAEGKGDKFMPFHRAGYDTKTGQVSHTAGTGGNEPDPPRAPTCPGSRRTP